MHRRMGLKTVLVALLLASGVGRAQPPLPPAPGSLPRTGLAGGVMPRPFEAQLPLVAPRAAHPAGAPVEPLAPIVVRASTPLPPLPDQLAPPVAAASAEDFVAEMPDEMLEEMLDEMPEEMRAPSGDWLAMSPQETESVPDVSLMPIEPGVEPPVSPASDTPLAAPTAQTVAAASIASVPPAAPLGPVGFWPAAGEPAAALMLKNQPELVEQLYDQVLELEPSGDNRRAIERVREVVTQTQVGVQETDENWVAGASPGIALGGRVHFDWLNWPNDADFGGQPNYVEFRRLRLSASGEGYGVVFYQLELEFAPEVDLRGTVDQAGEVDLGEFGVEMKDAFLGVREMPGLGTVLIGHFFVPLGLERLTSSNFTTFLERALPNVFLPGREVGIAAHNHLPNERLTWAFGAFFHEMDEATHAIIDDNQGTRLVGRVTGTPYYDELTEGRYLVHLGLGYGYTRPRLREAPAAPPAPPTYYRPVDFGARPEIHRGSSLISTGDIDTQQYHTTNAELAWVHGPLSMQSELMWTSLDQAGGGTTDLYGAYVFASYFLTGENRRYDRVMGDFKRVAPYENFWFVGTPHGPSSGWGAWEVACRWSYLDFSDVDGQQLNDLTVGVNWYWNPYTRLMFNWIRPVAKNSLVTGLPRDGEGDILAMRLQFDF